MIVLTAVAGGLGAALRLLTDGFVRRFAGDRLPWGTFAVNVVGSFALGALLGAEPSARLATVAGTGFLGGFTTFSTASLETAVLVLERRLLAGIGYAVLTLAAAVAAAAWGYGITG